MEENRRESSPRESDGKESRTTTYIVTRGYGEHDLLDLYTDYVVERIREDLRNKQADQAAQRVKTKEEKKRSRRDLTLSR